MPIRFADLDMDTSGTRDFIMRSRIPTIIQLLLIFIVALVASVSVTVHVADKVVIMMTLLLLFCAVGGYVAMILQRSRDLVLATEFQNTMFASALGTDNKFCLIIKTDGTIVYMDQAFQGIFPDFLRQPQRTIGSLLQYGNVNHVEKEKILAVIGRGVYDKVIFDIRASNNEDYKIVMSVEPILRPTGYILLRCREYIEQRVAEDKMAFKNIPLFSKSTISLFSYVMDTMSMGLYMAGPGGNIIYANPLLEQWLGFREGEITSGNLSLQDIIYQDGKRAGAIDPNDYEGTVTLQKKVGGLMKAFINQKVIRDDVGKVIGCTALVHHFVEPNTEIKKKLW